MIRFLGRALLLCAFLPSLAHAEVPIAPNCRVKNRPPGRCGWCALETLARHHHLTALYGLTQRHPSHCSARTLEEVVIEAKISYRIQYAGRRNRDILRYAIGEELGAVVGLHAVNPGAIRHMVTLVDLTEECVRVIDPNDAEVRTRSLSLDRFFAEWDGFALVVEPKGGWARGPHWESGESRLALAPGAARVLWRRESFAPDRVAG